jgi:hypothetical protein
MYLTLPIDSRHYYTLKCWQIVERVVPDGHGLTSQWDWIRSSTIVFNIELEIRRTAPA